MQEADAIPRLFTLPEASRRLGISHRAIRGAISRGDLVAVQLAPNGWPRLTELAVRELIAARQTQLGRTDHG